MQSAAIPTSQPAVPMMPGSSSISIDKAAYLKQYEEFQANKRKEEEERLQENAEHELTPPSGAQGERSAESDRESENAGDSHCTRTVSVLHVSVAVAQTPGTGAGGWIETPRTRVIA